MAPVESEARSRLSATIYPIDRRCWREASSGTTPPNGAWTSSWERTTLLRILRSAVTTAAAVSSQDVSMASMFTALSPLLPLFSSPPNGQALGVRPTGDTPLADDGADEPGRDDIEGRVADRDIRAGDGAAAAPGDFICRPFLDRDLPAAPQVEIKSAQRRRHIEGKPVMLGQNGQGICSDLVGGVAVPGDAVGARDDQPDLPRFHQPAGHVVGDQGHRNPELAELPDSQARPLQEWPRLIHEDVDLLALLMSGPDDAGCRAVAGCGQSAGVAVGQDGISVGDQVLTEGTDLLVGFQILRFDGLGLPDQAKPERSARQELILSVDTLHPLQSPEQVACGRPCPGQPFYGEVKLPVEIPGRVGAHDTQRHTIGGRDPDGRGPANDHRLDGPGHFLVAPAFHVSFLEGKLPLVNHHDTVVLPFNRRPQFSPHFSKDPVSIFEKMITALRSLRAYWFGWEEGFFNRDPF